MSVFASHPRVDHECGGSARHRPGRLSCPGAGHDDQVAGGALDQGCARTGPIFADDEIPFPVARDHPVGDVGAFID